MERSVIVECPIIQENREFPSLTDAHKFYSNPDNRSFHAKENFERLSGFEKSWEEIFAGDKEECFEMADHYISVGIAVSIQKSEKSKTVSIWANVLKPQYEYSPELERMHEEDKLLEARHKRELLSYIHG